MRVENFIALRYIKENRKNKDISSSSRIVITTIAVAIVFYICAVSIMNGYIHGRMQIQFELTSFHINYYDIMRENDAIDICKILSKSSAVRNCYYIREAKVLLSSKGFNSGLAYFRSVPESIFDDDKGFDKHIRLISGAKRLGKNEIMISQKTADKLKNQVGDSIYLSAMMTRGNTKVRFKQLKITGIFSTGFTELDEQLAFVSNSSGTEIFDAGIRYTVAVKLHDYKDTQRFAMANKFYGATSQTTWIEENFNELTALKFEKNVIAFIVILVIIVAVLNILTTIHITIMEKRQDIGVLKAIGYSPRNIITIFLLNGYYLGIAGIIIGVLSGVLIMNWIDQIMLFFGNIINSYNTIVHNIVSLFITCPVPEQIEIFAKDFYLDKIYTDISYIEILFVSFVTLLFAIIASIIPAIKGGKIKPNEVIKNG